MFYSKMCSTEVGYGYGVLRVNIRLKQRGVSAKIMKNDKNGWKASVKRVKTSKKRGASVFSNAGKTDRRKNTEKRFTKRVKQKEKFADLSPAPPSVLEEFCLQY